MNQINTLQYPTINGLKSLQLDNLTTDQLNATNMFLQNLEVGDIIIDTKLEFNTNAIILANGEEISDIEISYLNGTSSNIQNQLNSLDTRITTNENDITTLEDKTTKITYDFINDITEINSKVQINDILRLGDITHTLTYTQGTNYIIQNNSNKGTVQIKNKDSGGIVRTLEIDQFINVSGINDLRINKLYLAGSEINFTTYDNTSTNTQKISYISGTNTTLINSNSQINGSLTIGNTSYTQSGSNFIVQNNSNIGSYQIKNKDSGGTVRTLTIDQFINVNGINDLWINKLYLGGSEINFTTYNNTSTNTQKISYNSGTNTTTIASPLSLGYSLDVYGITTHLNDVSFLDNISMGGASSLTVGGVTLSQTELSYLDGVTSNIQTQLTNTNDKISAITYNSGTNTTSINGSLTIGNTSYTQSGSNFIVQNNSNAGSYQIKNKDSGGTIRTLTIDQFINVNGINDLWINRLYLGGTQINFTTYNNTSNNTQQISYTSSPIPSTNISTASGQVTIVPYTTGSGAYNPISQAGDTIMYYNNANINSGGALTIVPWTNVNSGIRLSKTETQIHNPKVMDSLKFPDNTEQTTAMTDAYIQSVVNAMSSVLNPPGVINAFAGSSAPSGWLLCQGQLISKTTYANLWAVIGNTYLNGRSADANNFYIPDLREFYIKGAGQNFTYTKKYTYSGGNSLGTFLDQEVLPHYHMYTDKGDGSVNRGTGLASCANNNQRTNDTGSELYHADGTLMTSYENRPQTLVLNYIIKY